MEQHQTLDPSGSATPEDAVDAKRTDLVLDCDTCAERHTSTCDDCVVTFLLRRRPGEAVVIDLDEHRSLRLLADAGLASPLRHVPDVR
ncbi:MAG: hypothetical protein CL441_00625 [Acidimicrobiaceae bacterium]|nr:hypothetical protein [Acidimicrobiaceae bacterium]